LDQSTNTEAAQIVRLLMSNKSEHHHVSAMCGGLTDTGTGYPPESEAKTVVDLRPRFLEERTNNA
jgi:hypothetical protein